MVKKKGYSLGFAQGGGVEPSQPTLQDEKNPMLIVLKA